MNCKRRYAVGMVVLLAVVSQVPAAGLVFQQVSWLDSAGSPVSRYSDWGRVEISLSSADDALFHPMVVDGLAGSGGFINVVSNAGGPDDWEIVNLPIFYPDPSELDGRLPQGVLFDLGVSPTTPVGSLDYYFTIDPAPLAVMPTTGTGASQAVVEFEQILSGESLWLGTNHYEGGGLASPQAAMDFRGAESGEVIASRGSISIPETSLATVNEDDNGCAPGAVARSIKYLSDAHENVNVPDNAQTVYGQLRTAMGTDANGTNTADILSGKDAYVAAHNLPITSTQTKDFKKAIDTLQHTGDVEIGVWWGEDADGNSMGSHRAMVTEVQELQDASGNTTGYVIKTVDDPVQGDGKEANSTHTMKFDANGKLVQYDGHGVGTGAGLINFQTEDVHASRVTLSFWGSSYSYPIPPGGKLPVPIPVGRAGETVRIGGLEIRFEGAADVGNPMHPVLSELRVNPDAEPEPSATTEMALDVEFEPIDPTQPTVLEIGLGLAHLLPDDITPGLFLPAIEGETGVLLENLVATSTFFDLTYSVAMPGEDPQIFRLHGEVPEELRGKAWLLEMYYDEDPDFWVESFFDVFFTVEMTPEAYELFQSPLTLLEMQVFGNQVPEPATLAILALGGLAVLKRKRRS